MVAVIKLAGSVLTGLDAFPRAASALAESISSDPKESL
jgi:hypothetical protein